MMRRAPAVLLTLLVSGCSSVVLEIGDPLDLEACAGFQAGVTRRPEVLDALGPPAAIARHADGVALLYESIVMDENQLGIGLDVLSGLIPGGALEFLKYSTGDSDVERDAVVVAFDSDGVLTWFVTSDWSEDYGQGSGLQFVVAVKSVVDSKALRQPPRSLTWGDEMFRVPPVALNLANLPDLELIGSPVGANRQRRQ